MKINIPAKRFVLLTLVATSISAVALVAVGQEPDDGYTGTNTVVTEGPDITVWDIRADNDYGPIGATRAYSVGTDSCNIGSTPALWCNPDHPSGNSNCESEVPKVTSTDHPVISTNLYRLKNEAGRFRQLGKSFLKHGFNSLNDEVSACRGNGGGGTPVACVNTATGPTLNVGCTDFYGAGTNADQPLAPRSEVNGATGAFPPTYTPPTGPGANSLDSRLQVDESEIDPSTNIGADVLGSGVDYWIEVHYVSPDDAMAGNGLNNASYVEATFSSGFSLDVDAAPVVREAAAIWAWKAAEPDVEIVRVDLDTNPVERFHVARQVTNTTRGLDSWHYEVVVHNMNSDRSARALQITFPVGTVISGAGFHDVDSHSGEIYSSADWTFDNSTANIARWSTTDFASDNNANAIRWGTSYTFWFDATAPPIASHWELELFTPGSPTFVTAPFGQVFEDGFESGDTTAWDE